MNNENNNLNQNINNGQINSTQQQFNNFQNSGFNNVQQPIQQPNVQSQYEKSLSVQTRKTNKFAIYSIISSSISIIVFWWLASVGIGYGIKALKDIKETGEKGKILAVLGILIGIINITLYFGAKAGLLN